MNWLEVLHRECPTRSINAIITLNRQLPEVADAVARARTSHCRAPHIDAESPLQIQDVISAKREIESQMQRIN